LQEVQNRSHYPSHTQSWIVNCLAWWINRNNAQDENVFNDASQELKNKKIIFSAKMSALINSLNFNISPLNYNFFDKEEKIFLCYLFEAVGCNRWGDEILNKTNVAKECFPVFLIRYRYSHVEFIQEDFLNFLFTLENQRRFFSSGTIEIYTLELIREACRNDTLTKQVVLIKVSDYIIEHSKVLLEYHKADIREIISYFFIKIKEYESVDAQLVFFTHFYERAVQESEDSYTELSILLRLREWFTDIMDSVIEKQPEKIDLLVIRCINMLGYLRKYLKRNKFPDDYNHFVNNILPMAKFVFEKNDNAWKALKPLLITFRESKKILVNDNMAVNLLAFEPNNIFFRMDNSKKLLDLRYDMAKDFIERLKPTKKERQKENYTEKEIKEPGFDLSYTEPSPFWRYAYVRALGDLKIKTDRHGHFFHEILKKALEKDPSEQVRKAAIKVLKGLDSIRKGYSSNNHKKCLFEAFWWLRQAHMLSLGADIDMDKAKVLRIREWR
jgi:hypothetical protein